MKTKTNDIHSKHVIHLAFDIPEFMIILLIIITGILLHFLSPYFLTTSNMSAVAIGLISDAIIAIGMTILLVSGGFDLSVGSGLALGGVIVALLLNAGFGIPISIIIALLFGSLVGIINGLVVTKLRVNPLIATLGMMSVARSVTLVISGGYPLASLPKGFTIFGQGYIAGIPISFILMIILAIVGDVLLRKSIFLRKVYYIGGNEEAAEYSGIKTQRLKVITYIITGTLAALAGILLTSRLGSASPQSGLGTELRVIAACVIGGASLNGGKGTVFGSILGVVLVNIINNGMVLLNISIYWQGLVSGLILVGAVALDAARRID